MKTFQVIFQPSGRRGDIAEGKTIIDASRELGVGIESLCGGERNCGKCKVRLESGHLSPFTEEENEFIDEKERALGYRLACAAQIWSEALIFVPEESRIGRQVARKEATRRSMALKPAVSLYEVELPPPTLHNLLGDFDRLQKALRENYSLPPLEIDHLALLRLPSVLRQGRWKATATVWMDKEIIDIRPGKAAAIYGFAVDVGTTTVVAYLCHLQTGELIATEAIMNPQVIYGEDIMSRIAYTTNRPEGLETIHRSIIEGLNRLIETLTQQCRLRPEDILDVTVVGNTVMHHLFLKISPEFLGLSPFPPVIRRSFDVKARELGLTVHPSAKIHVLPVEAGFVGADNVGVLITEEPYHQDDRLLIIDIGTNGELVMGNRKKLMSASCATGPALEGAHIKYGMRAAPGAVERIQIDPRTWKVRFKVVGQDGWNDEIRNPEAKGICGSGIIDGVAELYRTGLIDKTGRFRKDIPTPRLKRSDGVPEFVIAWKEETSGGRDITISQQDVRNVQLAKGALYTGAKLLMKKMGIEELDRVVLAGAFGSYVDPQKALILGMFPDCNLNRISAVGNAAGDGARIALLNREKRIEADEMARRVEYLELTNEKDFQDEFINALALPHGRDPFPHLKGIVEEAILNPGKPLKI
ncbi:MAG: DUF4445 domain-containing protein [Candidatus Aminicenantes bacterium]|nr:DUF4445 domain-containing protein [Candidatus Aminicenantes bacterium]